MSGRVIIYTGEGKGKTTAALGTVLRARGQGLKCLILQFMKGSLDTGELTTLQKLGVPVRRLGTGFSWTKESWDEDQELAEKGWQEAQAALASSEWDLIVLDEINYVLGYGLLAPEEVALAIKERSEGLHLILTGRGLDPALAQVADTISELKPIKHAFDAGIKATKGIEF